MRIDSVGLLCTVQSMVCGKSMIEENGLVTDKTEIEILPSLDADLKLIDFPIGADPSTASKRRGLQVYTGPL